MRMLRRLVARVVVIALVLAVLACSYITWRGFTMYREALEDVGVAQTVENLREQPGYTSIDQLPGAYLDAVVSVEDHRFYTHMGIDPIAICRALVNDIRTMSLEEGGSTITQQVAKNLFFTQDKALERKAAEVFMAVTLEAAYSKAEILELYVNSSYFGEGLTGIGQACPAYLGCAPQEMDEGACALMAGFPNAPSVFSADPDAAQARQQTVLAQVERYGGEVRAGAARAGVPTAG